MPSRIHLYSLAHESFPSSSKPEISYLSDLSSIIISFSDQSQERFTTFKALCDNIGPTWMIQVNFSISKFLTLITSGKSLFLVSLHIHGFQQIVWSSLGVHYPAYHTIECKLLKGKTIFNFVFLLHNI